MSSNDCTNPDHKRQKLGYCDDCGGCRKCPPGSPQCGANHVGTLAKRQPKSSTRKKGTTVIRSAKRKASEKISAQTKDDDTESDDEEEAQSKNDKEEKSKNDKEENDDASHSSLHVGSVHGLLKALNVDADVKIPLKKDANKRAISRWTDVMEQVLDRCLTVCVQGDIHPLKKELTARLVRKLNDKKNKSIDPVEVGDQKVVKNVLELAKNGPTEFRQVALGILSVSCSQEEVNLKLRQSSYQETRIERASKNKMKAASRPKKKRKQESCSPSEPNGEPQPAASATPPAPPAPPLPETNVMAVQQWKYIGNNSFAKYRKLMNEYLLQGRDPPEKSSATRIHPDVILQCVQWIASRFQLRPGKFRNYRLNGTVLKNIPVYIRDGKSIEATHQIYEATMLVQQESPPLGRISFTALLKVLTEQPSTIADLSYYYVDFINLVAELEEMLCSIESRLSESHLENCKSAIETAKTEVSFGADYLKYRLKNNLKKTSSNTYECCTFAIGGACDHEHNSVFYPLVRALSVHTSITGVANAVKGSNLSQEEQTSIAKIAKLSKHEFLHYTKHLYRDWWQHNHIAAIKDALQGNEAVMIINHKQKVLPSRQNGAMTDCFSKTDMSLCGTMLVTKDADGAFEYRFIDVIMENVTTQRADDVFPVFETVLKEVRKEYNIHNLYIVSDNATAFCSFSHIPFLNACNNHQDMFPKIMRWDYTEPQCGQSMLDTHFTYIDLQLRCALLDGIGYNDGVGYNDPHQLFQALTHNGGIRGTTVLLLKKFDSAPSEWATKLKAEVKLAVRSCASIVFDQDKVTLHHASGLDPCDTVSTESWETKFDELGSVLKRSAAADQRPFCARLKNSQESVDAQQGDNASMGKSNAFADAIKDSIDQHVQDKVSNPATADAGDQDTAPDNIMKKHWAKKEGRPWLELDDIKEKLHRFYMSVVDNQKSQVSAEIAVQIVKEDFSKIWDQRYLCSVTKVKQFYSTVGATMMMQGANLTNQKQQKGGPYPPYPPDAAHSRVESDSEEGEDTVDTVQDVLDASEDLREDHIVNINV